MKKLTGKKRYLAAILWGLYLVVLGIDQAINDLPETEEIVETFLGQWSVYTIAAGLIASFTGIALGAAWAKGK